MTKKQEKLVSILIPTYNRLKMCTRAIKSSINQTYSNIEVIVVDNASEDETFETLSREFADDKRVKIYKNDTNIGPVNNWIRAWESSSGEYIKILFSDDLLEADTISRMVGILDNNSDCAFVDSAIKICSVVGSEESYLYSNYATGKYTKDYFINHLFINDNAYSPGAALYRRDAFKIERDIEGKTYLEFNRTGAGIDTRISLNALANYKYYYHINEFLGIFTRHGTNLSGEGIIKYQYDVAMQDYLISAKCSESCMKTYWDYIVRRKKRSGFSDGLISQYCSNISNAERMNYDDSEYQFENSIERSDFAKNLLRDILCLSMKGIMISDYLIGKGYKKVAIYGFGYNGRVLESLLINTDVSIEYYIDDGYDVLCDKKIVKSYDEWENVDLLIITPSYDRKKIESVINSKGKINYIYFDELVNDMAIDWL